ncbi:hypothetical protein ASJ81_02505 [Methanosarcina spelaei]|uniref:Uncharacterized protein n=1 Tax=Methanosarcina spelaei TaxID=1036679 RepID=A0A2A2HXX5_9EURY|nr:hypothetical protein ASJ81_02505 [Methanosarcina spelaei]
MLDNGNITIAEQSINIDINTVINIKNLTSKPNLFIYLTSIECGEDLELVLKKGINQEVSS